MSSEQILHVLSDTQERVSPSSASRRLISIALFSRSPPTPADESNNFHHGRQTWKPDDVEHTRLSHYRNTQHDFSYTNAHTFSSGLSQYLQNFVDSTMTTCIGEPGAEEVPRPLSSECVTPISAPTTVETPSGEVNARMVASFILPRLDESVWSNALEQFLSRKKWKYRSA